MADVYIPIPQFQLREIDKMATRLHATRSDLIRYCVQQMLPTFNHLDKLAFHELMRRFENNEALMKAPVDTSEF